MTDTRWMSSTSLKAEAILLPALPLPVKDPHLPLPCCLGHVALCEICKRGKGGRLLEGKVGGHVPCPSPLIQRAPK